MSIMNEEDLSNNAREWLEVIRHDPLEWADGVLESCLDRDGVSVEEKDYILGRYKTFLH